MLPIRLSLVTLVTLALLAPLAAAAQEPDSTRRDTTVAQLPEIEVVGSITPEGPTIGSGVPANRSTITTEQLERFEPRILGDVLATQVGVSQYDDLGSPFKTTIQSRGFFASPVVGLPQGISVFLDGVPVNEPDAAQVNMDLLPMEHVRRVEVLNGTASLLGPNSLGGAINLVTNHGGGAAIGDLEVSGGSYDAYSVEGSVGGTMAGRWNYYAGGGYFTEDGWRQVTSAENYNGFLNLGRSTGRSGFNFQALYGRSRAEPAGSLPESVYDVKPDSNLSAQDFEDLDQVHLALAGFAPVGPGRGSANLYFRENDAERFNVNQINDPDVRSFAQNRTFGGSLDWRYDQPVGSGALGLRFGGGGSVSDVGIQLFAERIDPGQTTDVESDIGRFNLYSIADYRIGRVTFSGGARFDYIRIPFHNLLDPARDTTSSYTRLNPKGGVTVDAGGGLSVFASVGQSFRAPAVIELACADPLEPCPLPFALGDDPPLDPVIATTIEAGGRLVTGNLLLSGSVYRTGVQNEIILFPFTEAGEPEGSTIDGYFGNISHTRRVGVELGGQYFFSQGHSLYANYAFTRATYQVDGIQIFSIREEAGGENEVGKGDRFPLVPDHLVRFGGLAVLPANLSLGLDGRYIGRQYLRGDEANEEDPLDGYFAADVRLGWEIGPWEITGVVTNVFDAKYATFGTYNINQGAGGAVERFLTPGQMRQFRVVIGRTFGGGAGD